MMRTLTLLIAALVNFTSASQLGKWQEISELVPNEEIEKSPYDYSKYRAIVLKNGLKAFLTSDSNITSGWADLKIMSGYNEEPEELPRIMRLLMLYTQNKILDKFNDSLESFLNKPDYRFMESHTYKDMTAFQIKVNSSQDLAQSIARLAAAVKLLSFEFVRIDSLANKMCNRSGGPLKGGLGMNRYIRHKIFMPGFSPALLDDKFCTESLLDAVTRLDLNLADVLAELQMRHYLPGKMYLLVVSNQSLDDLTQLVVDKFGSLTRSFSRNWQLDRFKKRRENLNQIRQTGFAMKTGSNEPLALLELQTMNRLGVTIPRHILHFIDHCVNEATGYPYKFEEFLRNQSLSSWYAARGQVDSDIDVYGFSIWLSDFGVQNLDLVLNHTFRHINAAKLCLANSSKYSEYAAGQWGTITNKMFWERKDQGGARGFSNHFPSEKNVRKLLLSRYRIPKTIDLAEANGKYFSQLDAKNMIYVLSDKNVKEELDQTDSMTGLKYSVKKLDDKFLNMLNALEPATSETYAGIHMDSNDFSIMGL